MASSQVSEFYQWEQCNSVDDIINCNILSLSGTIPNPVCCTRDEPILTEDTLPFMKTIENINKNGFITMQSQPSSYEKSLDDELYTYDDCRKQELNTPIFAKEDGLYKTEFVQKAWCDGYIKYNILHKFIDNISKLGYIVYYYSAYHKLNNDINKRINVTYVSNGMTRYEVTNIHSVFELETDIVYHFSKVISPNLMKKTMEECVYICVIDTEFNSGKNIYSDILLCLKKKLKL